MKTSVIEVRDMLSVLKANLNLPLAGNPGRN
jgi:hypothetical protein